MTESIKRLAQSISPETIQKCRIKDKTSGKRIAKFAVESDEVESDEVESEAIAELFNTGRDTYGEIRAGFDNGQCTTRRGTYLKFKTGSGRRRK